MTRKQAVLKAISILEKKKENNEIVEKLKGICNELPLTKWNEENIFDAFQQYIIDNNETPCSDDLCGKLPAKDTLKKVCKVNTLSEYLKKNFPNDYNEKKGRSPYWKYTPKICKECFVRNYNAINNGMYVSLAEYNSNKEPGTPNANFFMKHLKCSTYRGLLKKLNLYPYKYELQVTSNIADGIIPNAGEKYEMLRKEFGDQLFPPLNI